MTFGERFQFLRQAWLCRLRTEKFGISFLLSRDLIGKTAIDICANRGIYSYWMHKKVGLQGRVLAFESQQESFVWLHQVKSSFELNQLEIVKTALAPISGSQDMILTKKNGGDILYPYGDRAVDTLSIKLTRLDDYLDYHPGGPIGFIKCDVTGHEYDVFGGGEQVLQQDRPDLLFECETQTLDGRTFEYLDDLDYQGYSISREGLIPCATYQTLKDSISNHVIHEFVFLPREKAVNTQLEKAQAVQAPTFTSAYANV